jgi:hypothetical protein
VALLSAAAVAADAPGVVELPRKAGTPLEGTVVSRDEAGATLKDAEGKEVRAKWEDLAPLGVFRVHAALAKPDDGPARLSLAELASELGLWAEARAEYERALALKALDVVAYQAAVTDAESRAIASGIAQAERAADAGDVAKALETARALKLDFAGARDAKRIDDLLASLDARIAAREAELLAFQKELEKALAEADRWKEVLKRRTEAKRQVAVGDASAAEARGHMPNGVVSRVRREVDEADAAYKLARRELGRLRRILPKDGKERAEAEAMLLALDATQYRLLLDAAKFFWTARVYDTAEDFAARASYLDPVDPALLELRSDMRGRRIRYRLSNLTNARPH